MKPSRQSEAAVLEKIRLQAVAHVEDKKRKGQWAGSVVAHTDYQDKPLEWIVEYLGVSEHTLRWSLNDGYKDHEWDGDVDPMVQILDTVAGGRDCGVESATGTGKMAWVDSHVLTPTGWKRMGDVVVGDHVIGSDGRPTIVLNVYPQGVRSLYRVTFSDGAESLVGAEHLWKVRSKYQKNQGATWRVMTTAELQHRVGQRWQIPIVAPVEFLEKPFVIDPYVLGVILGDGHIGSKPSSLAVTTADDSIASELGQLTGAEIVSRSAHGECVQYYLKDGGHTHAALGRLGLVGNRAWEKFVPEEYFTGSVAQRLAVLQGLMDTDGTVDARHGTSFTFSSSSRQLAQDVRTLALSLGATAKCRIKKTLPTYKYKGEKRTGRPCYQTQVQLPNKIMPFRLPRKIERVRSRKEYGLPRRTIERVEFAFNGEAQCIRVAAKDCLYLMDDYVVTHNTFLGACITLWFLATYENSIVITAAPKSDQLLLHIWKEMGRLWPRFQRHFPIAEFLGGGGKLRMKPDGAERELWTATAFVAGVGADEEVAQKAAGFHQENMLWITEETPGLHYAIMNTIKQTRTANRNLHLAFGNPDHQRDPLHLFCLGSGVKHIRISAFDHPNIVSNGDIVPAAIGPERLKTRIQDLGVGSRLYLSRVRGISPPEAEDALIRREWCEAAASRYEDNELRQGPLALGGDIADSPEGDSAALAYWQGACLTHVESFKVKVDANDVARRIFREINNPEDPIDSRYIGIDSVGVGASVVNELRRLGAKVRHISGGRRAAPLLDSDALWSMTEPDLAGTMRAAGPKVVEAEEYNNLRSQVWWRMRNDLRLGRIALPHDETLWQDLCTPTYKTQGGKICVETKDEIVKRLRHSPDKGDAACYGNFVRPRVPRKRQATKDELVAAGHIVPSKNRDAGLERMLKAHEQRRKREEQAIKRRFRRSIR